MLYNKLVRDNVPECIQKRGEDCRFHFADDEEYRTKLLEKLSEEVSEFQADEGIKELVDILEVIDAIIAYRGFDQAEIAAVKEKKKQERGGFEKRIILDES